MYKKSQITAFIIFGIIILGVAALVIYINTITVPQPEKAEVSADAQAVEVFIEGCLQRVGENGLLTAGIQGGYITIPERYVETSQLTIPYYYYNGERSVLKIEDVGNEIEKYIKLFLPVCLDDFKAFRLEGFEINGGKISSETIFGDKETIINLNYPLSFKRAGSEIKLENFSTKINIPFKEFYSIATKIADEQNRSNGIDFNLLDSLGQNITILGFENNTIVFLITNNLSKIRGKNYQFIFATKVKARE